MRYLVLGAGALGGYFGGMLLKGGADVTFLVRPRRAVQLERDGLIIKMQDGSELRTQVRTAQQGQLDGTYDVVLLTCKSYDLDDAMRVIAPAMGEKSVIVPVLNGVRHIDVLTAKFGPKCVLGGLTTINAALMSDGMIQQSQVRININVIGELDGRASKRCAAIKECTRVVTAAGYPPAPPPAPDTAGLMRGMFSQPDSTYGPSMLIDMEDGRPTEGEHTIGDIVERAARAGVSAPILCAARCNLQAYEINRGARP
jgi:2-dehydropantoate 2-reductase